MFGHKDVVAIKRRSPSNAGHMAGFHCFSTEIDTFNFTWLHSVLADSFQLPNCKLCEFTSPKERFFKRYLAVYTFSQCRPIYLKVLTYTDPLKPGGEVIFLSINSVGVPGS